MCFLLWNANDYDDGRLQQVSWVNNSSFTKEGGVRHTAFASHALNLSRGVKVERYLDQKMQQLRAEMHMAEC